MQCWAEKHGYYFQLLHPEDSEVCANNYKDFFFKKHCAVAEFMDALRDEGDVLCVLDGDTAIAGLEVSLDRWLGNYEINSPDAMNAGSGPAFDIVFYERAWNFELAAGNYLARNSPYTRFLLRRWADFEWRRPWGFSSSDNGAVHQLIIEEFAMGWERAGLLGTNRFQTGFRPVSCRLHSPCHSVNSLDRNS